MSTVAATQPFTGTYRAQPVASTFGFAVRHSGVFWYRGSLSDVAAIEAAAESSLQAETFTTTTAFDALNRPTRLDAPLGYAVLPTYNDAGLLETVSALLRGAATPTTFVASIDYDARGTRQEIVYGSGVRTTFTYDVELKMSVAAWFNRTIATVAVTNSDQYDNLTRRHTMTRTIDGRVVDTLMTDDDAVVQKWLTTISRMPTVVSASTSPACPARASHSMASVWRPWASSVRASSTCARTSPDWAL